MCGHVLLGQFEFKTSNRVQWFGLSWLPGWNFNYTVCWPLPVQTALLHNPLCHNQQTSNSQIGLQERSPLGLSTTPPDHHKCNRLWLEGLASQVRDKATDFLYEDLVWGKQAHHYSMHTYCESLSRAYQVSDIKSWQIQKVSQICWDLGTLCSR